jgi:hypothetical protein
MNAFIKSYDKSHKKSSGKGKRKRSDSDIDPSDYDSNYSNSYKHVALKPKRAKMVLPTTEVIGGTNVNGKKSNLMKNKRTTTEWTTLGGKFYT